MRKESMTPKERWLAVLNHEKPDRVPMDYWATNEVTQKLMKDLSCQSQFELMQKLHVDIPISPSPTYIGPPLPANTDVFGVKYRDIDYGTGVYQESINAPLAAYTSVEEIEANYQWPQLDWLDYSSIPDQIHGFEDYPIKAGGSEPMLTYKQLRGEEQAMMDLALNPEIVSYCLEKLFDFSYKHTTRIYEALPAGANPTFTYVAEDLGSQKNLMYSPRHIKKYLFPGMKKMIDLAHSAGARAFHHDDGNITKILPDLIELGIDILNPIQWRADGMDRKSLKRLYGDKIIFHGAVDNQFTLPFGTPEDVRQEVLDNLAILGENGGYIIAPCHNIQPNTPTANIVALYETGYNNG